jgi:hypothetical protein
VLGSPLIVILAHTTCGAVKAACDVVTKNATYPGAIGPMIEPILPAVLAVRNDPGDFVNNAAKESARRTAGRLTTASTLIAGLAGDTLHLNNLPQAFFKNLPTAVCPHRYRRGAPALAPALQPLYRRTHTHLKTFGRLASRRPCLHSFDNAFPQASHPPSNINQ